MKTKGCLVFFVDAGSTETVEQIKSRLTLDYSPAVFSEGPWFLAQAPIQLPEFSDVISYMSKLERLFSVKDYIVRIVPGCLSSSNLVWGSKATEPRAVCVGQGSFAELGGVLDSGGVFRDETAGRLVPPLQLFSSAAHILAQN
jgi:hypothetical protein